MFIDCTNCRNGRIVEEGFDGRTARQCGECKGTGEIELTREEEAIMERFLADIVAQEEAMATVAEVETFLGASAPATPMPMPVHPNMSAKFFDAAVKRAFDAGLSISATGRADTVAVNSGTDPDVYYLVTLDTCECAGHAHLKRCWHRAFYCWFRWVQECDAIAASVTVAEPIAA